METDALTLLTTYRYWVILPLAVFEGPLLAVMLGFLCSLNLFEFIPVFFILTIWDFVRDIFLYHVGRAANHKDFLQKYSAKLAIQDKHYSILSSLWKIHSYKTMLFAKFAFGLSPILIMTAGIVRMSVVQFARIALEISMLEYALFLLIGYYFGDFYMMLTKNFHYTSFVLAACVIIFLILYVLWARTARNFFMRPAKKS